MKLQNQNIKSNFLKKHSSRLISYVGSHVQALPLETLKNEKSIDFIFTIEGVYALWKILKLLEKIFTPQDQ